jgi:SAM-dependent methyltransferase
MVLTTGLPTGFKNLQWILEFVGYNWDMSDRKSHWDGVYAGKSPLEVSWYQQNPTLSLKLIRDTGLEKEAPLIDVGGGASVLVDVLLDVGHTSLTVLDISAGALAHAQRRLGDKAHLVEWIETDVTAFDPPRLYRLWHDRAVFHFLTDVADQVRYVETLKRSLQPGGHAIIMTFAVGGPKKCSGLDIVQYDSEKLLGVLGSGFELLETGHETHLTPGGGQQKFAWFHLVSVTGERA